ncbi:MAG: hypothetical protein JWO31_436 [Phycisphaerales bacterium]|nr:hypothetical protein [Phycisphaerales bacterium]
MKGSLVHGSLAAAFTITRAGLRSAAVTVATLAGVAAVGSAGGCAANVRPAQQMLDPVSVFIGDYGVHSSLFLPTTDGRYVEYAFGDWGYAVENHNGPQDAIGALTVSQGAGFGRVYHDKAAGRDEPNPPHKPSSYQRVACERSDVYALVDRLDVRYEHAAERHGEPVLNPETGIAWVRDDQRYSIANNCNHMTARSLEELGCRVSGTVVWSNFKVKEPTQAATPAAGPDGSTAATTTGRRTEWASVE